MYVSTGTVAATATRAPSLAKLSKFQSVILVLSPRRGKSAFRDSPRPFVVLFGSGRAGQRVRGLALGEITDLAIFEAKSYFLSLVYFHLFFIMSEVELAALSPPRERVRPPLLSATAGTPPQNRHPRQRPLHRSELSAPSPEGLHHTVADDAVPSGGSHFPPLVRPGPGMLSAARGNTRRQTECCEDLLLGRPSHIQVRARAEVAVSAWSGTCECSALVQPDHDSTFSLPHASADWAVRQGWVRRGFIRPQPLACVEWPSRPAPVWSQQTSAPRGALARSTRRHAGLHHATAAQSHSTPQYDPS